MLLLTKIRLVNWHFFIDEIIEAGQATLLAGDNGSGKSTVIDAIQYALVANIRRIKFNAAATEKRAGRTLESYCRCRVGTENREYLRDDTITHVMLQFEDGDKVFSAGIMVESLVEKADSSEYPWIADDRRLESIPVYEGSQFIRPGEFREKIKDNGGTVCATKQDYNSRLTHRFGVHRKNMEFNPYLEALVRSVSFSPFTSVHDFVCNYILEERQVDVSAMRENLQNYREAESEANLIREKIDSLENVERVHHELKKIEAQIVSQQYLKKRADLELCGQRIHEYTRLVDEKNRRLKQLEDHMSTLRDRKKRLETSRQELLASLYNNDTYMALQSLERSIEEVRSRRDEARRGHEKYLGLKDEAEKLLNKTISEDVDGEIHEAAERVNGLRREAFETEQRIRQNQDQLTALEGELEDLRKGILRYPETTTRLQAALAEEGIQARVLADCLEVNDQSWQNALEGWLAGRRFNLLVSEKDFKKALTVYDSMPGEVHTVGIPDMEKIKGSEITPGALAEVVVTENPLARRYVSYVLGDVMMATLDNLRQYRKSVTRECMRYSSFTASRINERLYGQWYIGKQARERRRRQVEEEMAGLRELLREQRSSLEALVEAIARTDNAVTGLREMKHYTGEAARAEELESELDGLETEMGLVDQSEVKDLRERVASMETETGRVEDEIESVVKETGSLESDIRKYTEEKQRQEVQQQELRGSFELFMEERGSMREELEKYYHERVKNDSLEGVLSRFESSMKGFVTRENNTRKELHRLKNEYNRNFATYMSPDDDESGEFLTLLKKYRDTDLPAYSEKIARAREDAEKQFKEHFVSRLNEYQQEARTSFKEINDMLKEIRFGKDQYRFSVEEHPDKKAELHVIKTAARITEDSGTLWDQLHSSEERESVSRLFDTILENDLDSEQVRDICDYRQYFLYDIKIRHIDDLDETGKPIESSLSRVLRDKSGGETQTPYYVALAASFYRYFKDEPGAIRLVLFDEAFNKMDDDRIKNAISLFRGIGMQVLAAVPTEKVEIIAPQMDVTNLVIRSNRRAFVRDYAILQEKEHEPQGI